jgi:serine/threonine protein kinase
MSHTRPEDSSAKDFRSPETDPSLSQELSSHPRYRIVRQLGEGGMGTVYLAQHVLMDRMVALKVMNQALMSHPEAIERFLREVKTAAKLDHENIVRAFDAEQVGSFHLLVMEYVDGESLDRVVAKEGPLPIYRACDYLRQVAEGLESAHQMHTVHRDIKPSNLILSKMGLVKILDFGLAKLRSEKEVNGALTRDNAMMGTPAYLAPEQATDARSADIRADIYSLGCTLYFLLTGKPPFEGNSVMSYLAHHMQTPAPSISSLRAEVPPELAQFIERMVAKKPEDRPQTPQEIVDALGPFCKDIPSPETEVFDPRSSAQTEIPTQNLSVSQNATLPDSRLSSGKKKGTRKWIVGGLLIGVVAIIGILLANRSSSTDSPKKEEKSNLIANTNLPIEKENQKEEIQSPVLIQKTDPVLGPKGKPVISRFGLNDTEGWTTHDVRPKKKEQVTSPVVIDSEGKNYFLKATDLGKGPGWMWYAPKQYLGDHSEKYGKYLKFRLKTDRVAAKPDPNWTVVAIRTEGLMIRLPLNARPKIRPNQWNSYSIRLDTSEDWRTGPLGKDQGKSSKEEIQRVLKQINSLMIRGEFFGGNDVGRLDDVEFGVD